MPLLIFLFLCTSLAICSYGQAGQSKDSVVNYTSNPALRTIKPNWPGTPLDKHKRFVNHEFPYKVPFSDVLKWQLGEKPQKGEKKQDTFRLITQHDKAFFSQTNDCIVWLGHATFFIRLHGVSILIDPVFYDVPFVKRYAQHAFSPALFAKLDYILISHDHQDHCQKKSIKALVAHNPNVKILAGLHMESLLRPWVPKQVIQTAGWYQQYAMPDGLNIYYLPSRHWSKRSLNDDNKRLWGAFVFETNQKTIYFSGDTGYGSHFKEAKELFPHFDVAIIGVGAYKPTWFMSANHISPQDAVKAFHDLGAKVMIPMHYGTFDLSDEPVGEPYRILKEMESREEIKGTLKALDLGENYLSF